eukprot:891323-Amorphochlora_amoeboformis.AAC.1
MKRYCASCGSVSFRCSQIRCWCGLKYRVPEVANMTEQHCWDLDLVWAVPGLVLERERERDR